MNGARNALSRRGCRGPGESNPAAGLSLLLLLRTASPLHKPNKMQLMGVVAGPTAASTA